MVLVAWLWRACRYPPIKVRDHSPVLQPPDTSGLPLRSSRCGTVPLSCCWVWTSMGLRLTCGVWAASLRSCSWASLSSRVSWFALDPVIQVEYGVLQSIGWLASDASNMEMLVRSKLFLLYNSTIVVVTPQPCPQPCARSNQLDASCSALHLGKPAHPTLPFHTSTLVYEGNDETDQTDKIFKMMGTPTEQTWPGISKLPQ